MKIIYHSGTRLSLSEFLPVLLIGCVFTSLDILDELLECLDEPLEYLTELSENLDVELVSVL